MEHQTGPFGICRSSLVAWLTSLHSLTSFLTACQCSHTGTKACSQAPSRHRKRHSGVCNFSHGIRKWFFWDGLITPTCKSQKGAYIGGFWKCSLGTGIMDLHMQKLPSWRSFQPSVDARLASYSTTAAMNSAITSAKNATLAGMGVNYSRRTVADLLALDSAAKQLGHKVDKQIATVLLDRPSATDLKPDFEKPGLRRRIDVFTAPAPRDSRSPHPGSCKFPIGQSTRRPGKFRSDFPKKIMGVWEGGSMWLRQSCRLWLPPKTYYCYTVSSTEQLGENIFP